MRINKHDTNGTKPLLGKGELGYDDYSAGGDTGRVYVGTSTENIALAKRLESNTMTKSQFNALAEERKANRAGSGFDEFGKHYSSVSETPVNNGLIATSTYSNGFTIGRRLSDGLGISKTKDAYFCISGVVSRLLGTNITDTSVRSAEILLPTAPNIYPYDTVLTAEQIASGVIKHADASNSGLIVNGKFNVDASGWITTGVNWNWSAGSMVLSSTSDADQLKQNITTVNGKKYIVEFDITALTGNLKLMNTALTQLYTISRTGRHTVELLGDVNLTSIIFTRLTAGVSASCTIDNIAVYPADAISRSDLVFLESWHEDISEKNFVYPLGNVQYLSANTDGLTGIANGAFTGFETYSLCGNWQTSSALIGKGYVWSSLTEAQKKALIANPENNCYLDGDKIIQVRYRVRVVQGLGDSWENIDTYSSIRYSASFRVRAKGLLTSISYDTGAYIGTSSYAGKANISTLDSGINRNEALNTSISYSGEVFALPIALVHRRNQGMYHPVYNPNGTKKASDSNFWYNTAVSFTSISDCFDSSKLLTASGYIGSVSGRPDGLFYDQVHEGDILDLRSSSKKVEDYNRLISREFNKLVAGTTRGKEGERFTEIKTQTTTGTVVTVEVNDGTKYKSGDVVYIYDLTASVVKGRFVVKSVSSNTLTVDVAFAKLANSYMISGASSTRTKSNTLSVCDVIGNPANYPSIWKTNEDAFTTLHTAEDGTSLLPDGAMDSFKLSRKANTTPLLCLRSINNGATWTSFTPTFSITTNAITLTDEPATNLVMVYYQTHTSMAVPVVNSEGLEIGEVLGTAGVANGHLVSTLIGKVTTANTAPYSQRGYGVNGYRIDMSTFKFSTTSTEVPAHSALSLAGGAVGVIAVKMLPYLTRLNGKAYLNVVFKEMKHNGTSWGDDNKFNIVDNVSTTTDLNAQTVLIGQKTVELPYFIGADE